MEQRSPEWFAMRCGKITGSRFADVMAIGCKGQPLQARRNLITTIALERLTKTTITDFKNPAMQWGIDHENEAREWYMFEKNCVVQEQGFLQHPSLDYIGVSPDGLIDDEGGVEFKCPFNMERHMTTLLEQKIPEEYFWQVQGCLWVSGRQWWDYVSYDPRFPIKHQGVLLRAYPDQDAFEKLHSECKTVNQSINEQLIKLGEL